MNRPCIPAPTNEDRIPHDKAVWREIDDWARTITKGRPIAIEYADGRIAETWGHMAHWRGAVRFRFGWGPR